MPFRTKKDKYTWSKRVLPFSRSRLRFFASHLLVFGAFRTYFGIFCGHRLPILWDVIFHFDGAIFGVSMRFTFINSHLDVSELCERWVGRARVKNRNSKKQKNVQTHVPGVSGVSRARRVEIEFIFVSFKLKYAFVWPQKCLSTLARENNVNMPSLRACVCVAAKGNSTQKNERLNRTQWKWTQNEANRMWRRRCRRLLLMLVVVSKIWIWQTLTCAQFFGLFRSQQTPLLCATRIGARWRKSGWCQFHSSQKPTRNGKRNGNTPNTRFN